MAKQTLERIFWLAPIVLQIIIAIAMFVRGLYRRVPYFFAYTVNVVVQSIVLLLMEKPTAARFYAYWSGEVISWILGMAVIYEIYASLLKEYSSLQKLGTFLFGAISVSLVLVSLFTSLNSPGADSFRLMQGALTLERSVRIVQCGLLVALFLFSSFFGLGWKNYLFGIALGFAIFISVELAVVALRAYSGASLNHLYRWLKPGSYDLAVVVWGIYVIRSSRVADLRLLPKTQLAEWNQTLQELLHR
jgi:hypothetical protein